MSLPGFRRRVTILAPVFDFFSLFFFFFFFRFHQPHNGCYLPISRPHILKVVYKEGKVDSFERFSIEG